MTKRVSIADFIVDNYEKIKDRTYEWKNEEIDALYKLINSRLYFYNVKLYEREDLMQTLIIHVLEIINTKIDIANPESISSYLVTSIDNKIKNYMNYNKKQVHPISLDARIHEDDNEFRETFGVDVIIDTNNDIGDNRVMKEYTIELKKLINYFDCLRLYYQEDLNQEEISKIYNVSRSNISERVRMQADAVKIILMSKGYGSEFVNTYISNEKFSDEYKYVESLIEKYGLFNLLYNKKTDIKELKESLNMDSRAIYYALDYFKDEKAKVLKEMGYKYPRGCIRLSEYVFPNILSNLEEQSPKYFKYLEKLIEKNKIIYLRFEEGKKIPEIAREYNKTECALANRFSNMKKRMIMNIKFSKNGEINIINKKR